MAVLQLSLGLGDGKPIKPSEQVLDGRRYLFEVSWVGRASLWTLDIRAADGTLLLAGIPIRVGQNILRPHVTVLLPGDGLGALVPLDTSGAGTDATRDDLDVRVKLMYSEAGT